jgi:hypothetical protein
MSWLPFAARKWFSAAVTIARRCDGRAWNVRHTKFPNLIRAFRPMRNPATCHFFCVQIGIDRLSPASIHYLSRIETALVRSETGMRRPRILHAAGFSSSTPRPCIAPGGAVFRGSGFQASRFENGAGPTPAHDSQPFTASAGFLRWGGSSDYPSPAAVDANASTCTRSYTVRRPVSA